MRALFAPDWRAGVPYQRLLAEALAQRGVPVDFLQNYRRGLPLWRLCRERQFEVLHLHWPEAYYPLKGDAWDWWRRLRWPLDLAGATRGKALAITAHNLEAHNRPNEPFGFRNTQASLQRAGVVFAHSAVAKERLVEKYGLDEARVRVIAHGDLSVTLGTPLPRAEARAALGLGEEPVCLMFGAVEPYKGIEPVVEYWARAKPEARLVVAGKPISPEYAEAMSALAATAPGVEFRNGWISDEALRQWLSAVDVVVFNYRSIFTSGAAALARSFGVPLVLPERLETVILDEPTPLVQRFASFEDDFGAALQRALNVPADYATAAAWRRACAWEQVAAETEAGYLAALQQ